ncbi:ribonuclease III family protein [Candidatus Cytomitobacter primus]|uniref:ribonuclease III family protein n=1 Tax=Candidatus Cytomitobacter primus TaxID=2066024 RepID=UPI001653CB5A|nr:putative dsRNA-binding protein [Candidatus Cytomitobacter primus]
MEDLFKSLSKKIQLLEKNINYNFKNDLYAQNAIIHPSYKKSKFELLEFMGDRVLNLAISQIIWDEQYKSEREYAEKLATKVNKYTLLEIAKIWNIKDYIIYIGEHIDSILVDACESIIGAVFLDGGWDSAYKLIKENWPKQSMSFAELDPKSILQQWIHQTSKQHKYTLIKQDGPPHNPQYTVELQVNQQKIIGVSRSIRLAEKSAAFDFLKKYTNLIKK